MSARVAHSLTRVLGFLLVLPFMAMALVAPGVMPARSQDGAITMVICACGCLSPSTFNASGCTSESRRSAASGCFALSSVPAWLTRMDSVSGCDGPCSRLRTVMTCSSSGSAAAWV